MSFDTILTNATVLTMDPARPRAGAVGIKGDRIAWVGDPDDVATHLTGVRHTMDLGGATVVPGFNDAHNHLLLLGHWLSQIDCSFPTIRSISEIVGAVGARVAETPEGEWIEGRGYDDNKLHEHRHPTRWDLDAVAPHNPVLIRNASGHMCVVNSRALEIAGITAETEPPFGGAIHIDPASGEPSGLLQEIAQKLIPLPFIPSDHDALHRCLDVASRAYLSAGITSSQEAGIFSTPEFTVFQQAWEAGTLPLRTYMMIRAPFLDALEKLGIYTGFGDDRLRVGSFKLLADGSLIGRTALVSEPFLEDPRSDNLGLAMMPQEELDDLIWRGHSAGWQVAIHAIGDRGIEMCLDGFERALARKPRADHRHRLEHCGILRPDLIRRIKDMGVIPVGQPPFVYEFGDGFLRHLGRERSQLTYALKTVLDAGIPLAASSDSPVSSFQPLIGIKLAVTERTATGTEFAPAEAISVEQAIALYTSAGAFASFDEQRKGTITPGKLADFAILGADPRTVPADEIDQIPVLGTISGGQLVYESALSPSAAVRPEGAMSLLSVRNLAAEYRDGDTSIRAVDGVSFDVEPGEIVGLVGESGCGKTTVGFSLLGLLPPNAGVVGGEVTFDGHDLLNLSDAERRALRGNRIAMIFQDPMTSLDPSFTIGDQLMEPLQTHLGLGRQAARQRAIDLLTQVGIPSPVERLRRYPHEFSGGMRQRVVIAIALACDPALLICDEPTSALDVTVQAQILSLLRALKREHQQTGILMITHDLGVVAQLCHRVAVMYAGQIVEQGPVRDVFAQPRHPYTRGLLGSLPGRVARGAPLSQIDGTVPDPRHLPSGCRFHPRCQYATAICQTPPPTHTVHAQQVACVLYDKGAQHVFA